MNKEHSFHNLFHFFFAECCNSYTIQGYNISNVTVTFCGLVYDDRKASMIVRLVVVELEVIRSDIVVP